MLMFVMHKYSFVLLFFYGFVFTKQPRGHFLVDVSFVSLVSTFLWFFFASQNIFQHISGLLLKGEVLTLN